MNYSTRRNLNYLLSTTSFLALITFFLGRVAVINPEIEFVGQAATPCYPRQPFVIRQRLFAAEPFFVSSEAFPAWGVEGEWLGWLDHLVLKPTTQAAVQKQVEHLQSRIQVLRLIWWGGWGLLCAWSIIIHYRFLRLKMIALCLAVNGVLLLLTIGLVIIFGPLTGYPWGPLISSGVDAVSCTFQITAVRWRWSWGFFVSGGMLMLWLMCLVYLTGLRAKAWATT